MSQHKKHIEAANGQWSFEGIASDFDDHIKASVPLYSEGHQLICEVSDFFLPPSALITEIGCSTGQLAHCLLQHHEDRQDLRYVGLDTSADMLEAATKKVNADPRATFIENSVVDYQWQTSSLVVSYYTLQFVHPRQRQLVIDAIYQNLEWGGALVLFEKVRAPDARFQDMSVQLYNDYKLRQGFSEREISNKSRSLKGVLEPFSTQGNLDMLTRAGFVDVMSIAKWVCFEGFLAIK